MHAELENAWALNGLSMCVVICLKHSEENLLSK